MQNRKKSGRKLFFRTVFTFLKFQILEKWEAENFKCLFSSGVLFQSRIFQSCQAIMGAKLICQSYTFAIRDNRDNKDRLPRVKNSLFRVPAPIPFFSNFQFRVPSQVPFFSIFLDLQSRFDVRNRKSVPVLITENPDAGFRRPLSQMPTSFGLRFSFLVVWCGGKFLLKISQ